MKYAVCPTCEGRGSHVNPGVDGHGITAEEMDELGEDFREDYLSGVYDVACEECRGLRVVPACRCGKSVAEGTFPYGGEGVDTDRPYSACYDHLSADEREWFDSEREMAAMYAAERRVGA